MQAAGRCIVLRPMPARPAAGEGAANALFASIQALVIRTLLAVQPAMINDKHCFEVRPHAAAAHAVAGTS